MAKIKKMKETIENKIRTLHQKLRKLQYDVNDVMDKVYYLVELDTGELKLVTENDIVLAENVMPLHAYLPQKPKGSAYYEIDELLKKIGPDKTYSVEYKANGFHVTVHKKDSKVKIFSEQKKDITNAFSTLLTRIQKLYKGDFVVDGELVLFSDGKIAGRRDLMKFIGAVKSGKQINDENVGLFIWDIVYLDGELLTDMPLRERRVYLKKLKFHDKIHIIQFKLARGLDDVKKAIEWASKLQGSEGAVIKDIDAKYKFGEAVWLKFRKLVDIDCVVLRRNIKKRGLFNYTVGIYLRAKDKNINPWKITTFNDRKVLVLGNTFNTTERIDPGEIVSVLVEEVWRHKTNKGIHYSIHKPRLAHVTEKKETSTVDDLEDIVTSIGVAVVEQYELKEDDEGKEIYVRDFPIRMQRNFKLIMEDKLWMPWVMQIHTIGRKLHRDFRFFIPSKDYGLVLTYHKARELFIKKKLEGILEGITLFKPATIEESDFDAQHHIQGTIKVPQPVSWLFFDGITHKVGTAGTRYPGVFVIAAHGVYTIEDVGDHKIVFHMRSDKGDVDLSPLEKAKKEGAPIMLKPPKKLQQFNGFYSFHIAHIEKNRWIMLFDKLKVETNSISPYQLSQIYELTMLGIPRPQIADVLNLSSNTIYKHQRKLGLI